MKLPEELQFIANARMMQKTTEARMDGRVCILTGATSGVGYQAAKRLAQGGAHLVLVCRNSEKAAKVKEDLKREYGIQIDNHAGGFFKTGRGSENRGNGINKIPAH